MGEILSAGGPVLYIIIFCSVVALAFTIERFISFRQAKTDIGTFLPNLENTLKLGKWDEALDYCVKSKGIIPKVMATGLLHKDENADDIRLILIDEIQINALPTLNKNLSLLMTIAKAAPMLGLLGTVLGMIQMFEVISTYGLGDPQKMAKGIGLALVTTAAGLIVTIPIVFTHAYFKSCIRNFERDLYSCLSKFLRIVRKRKELAS